LLSGAATDADADADDRRPTTDDRTVSYELAFDQQQPFGLSLSKPCTALRSSAGPGQAKLLPNGCR